MTATSSSRAATVANSGAVLAQASGNVPRPCASSVKTCSIPRAAGERTHDSQCAGVAEHEPWFGVVQEIFDLGLAVGGVERQINQVGAQAAEIEEQRLRRFFRLHRHAVAGFESKAGQEPGIAGRRPLKIVVAVTPSVLRLDAGLRQARAKPLGKQAVQIGVHVRLDVSLTGRHAVSIINQGIRSKQ